MGKLTPPSQRGKWIQTGVDKNVRIVSYGMSDAGSDTGSRDSRHITHLLLPEDDASRGNNGQSTEHEPQFTSRC